MHGLQDVALIDLFDGNIHSCGDAVDDLKCQISCIGYVDELLENDWCDAVGIKDLHCPPSSSNHQGEDGGGGFQGNMRILVFKQGYKKLDRSLFL
jgi:hypothetical protein